MKRFMRWLAVLLLVPLSSWPALAKSKFKHKHKAHKSSGKHAKRHDSASSGRVNKNGIAKSDLDAKALVRKKAPLILEERTTGTSVRLNKDGTFGTEGSLRAYNSQGRWKIKNGKLVLKWNTGEEHSYKILFSGKTPILNGRMPNKSNLYVL